MVAAADEFREKIQQNIAKYGVHVWAVGGDGAGPTFVYTTGLAEKNLPEFLVVGFDPLSGHRAITALVERLKNSDGKALENGEVIQLTDDPASKIVIFDARDSVKDQYTIQTGQFYRTQDYRVQQILIPDEAGRFPNDPNCDYYLQPMLAAMPVAATSLTGMLN